MCYLRRCSRWTVRLYAKCQGRFVLNKKIGEIVYFTFFHYMLEFGSWFLGFFVLFFVFFVLYFVPEQLIFFSFNDEYSRRRDLPHPGKIFASNFIILMTTTSREMGSWLLTRLLQMTRYLVIQDFAFAACFFCRPFANSGWRDISSWRPWCSGWNSFLSFFKVWKASLWSLFTYLFTLALRHTFYYKVPYKRIALWLWRDNSSATLTEVKKKILLPVADDEISRHNKINSI